MLSHRHFAKILQRASKRPLSAADQPFDQIDFVSQTLMIEAHLLKIIKQTLLRVPEAMDRVFGKFPERILPLVFVLLCKRNRVPQTSHQTPHIIASFLLGGQPLSVGVCPLCSSNGARNRIDRVASFVGSIAFAQLTQIPSIGLRNVDRHRPIPASG